ncbi:hypothetical protein FO519_000037 [Halicephalobus sp. NKZ332]|nr:hypothetical protein FO519_000037 [Halicephalobus sp. NKZ332]
MGFHDIVEAQRKYFLSGATYPLGTRKEALKTLKQLTSENADELCKAVHDDLRRNPAVTSMMEVKSNEMEIDYFLQHLDDWAAPTRVEKIGNAGPNDDAFIVKDPKGVVLLIAPWNYPVSMCFWPLVAILGAGNTCIIKPSELAPNCANLIEKLVKKYFDPRLVTVVQGGVSETTELLKERFDHIMYTGAPPVAKIIMTAAAKYLTPVTLELGGKCPVVVEPDADLDKIAQKLVQTKWLNVGQTCVAPDYVLTREEVRPKLAKAIEGALKNVYGDDTKNHPLYSRIVNERHFDRLSAVKSKSKGEVLVKHGGDSDRSDRYIAPHVISIDKDDAFMEDEIFGPFLPILATKDFDEAIEYIKSREKPLAGYLFTNDEQKIEAFLEKVSAGGMTINDVMKHLSIKTLPFGGVGNSGMGRYNGKYGFDTFTHEKFPTMADSKCMKSERNGIQREKKEFVEFEKSTVRKSEGIVLAVLEKTEQVNEDEEVLRRGGHKRSVKKDSVSFEKQESEDFQGDRGRKRKEPFEDLVVAEDYVEIFFFGEEADKDDSEVFDELLELCSWYDPVDDRNSSYGNTDEEDEIIARLSANTAPRPAPPPLFRKNTSVGISLSSLRLTSSLPKKPMQREPSDFWDNLDAIDF